LNTTTPNKLTLSVPEAASVIGIGKSTLWRMIAEREISAIKIGGRTLIRDADLRAFIDGRQNARAA
jgi:excisionase family DNA binding protein